MGELYDFNMLLICSVTTLQYYLSVSWWIFIPALHLRWGILNQIMTGHSLTNTDIN